MLEKIKETGKKAWEKIKAGGRWIKSKTKEVLIWTGIVGVAVAAGTIIIPEETIIPSLTMFDQTIEFSFTDDNTNENLLTYTEKGVYEIGYFDTSAEVIAMVEEL